MQEPTIGIESKFAALGQWVYVHRWDFAYRVVVSIILLAWLHLFPKYVLMIYCAERGIPPSELIGEELPGTHILLAWTMLVLTLFGLYLWLPFILAILKKFYIADPIASSTLESPPSRFALALGAPALKRAAWAMSGLVAGLILLFAFASGNARWELIGYFAVFSLALVLCVFLFIRRDVSSAIVSWRGPLAFVFLCMLVPVAFQPAVVSILDSTMRQFRIGGLMPVRVELLEVPASTPIVGKLVLLGKRNIYVEVGEGSARQRTVIANSQNLKVTISQRDTTQ